MGKRRLLELGKVHRRREALPQRLAYELKNPVQDHIRDYVVRNRESLPLPFEMCREGQFAGQRLALCGAGPSLVEHYQQIRGVDQVWACNSALPFLVERGVPVTAGVGIDQTAVLLDEWITRPDVQYYLATTVDPALVAHLRERRVAWFHNYCGLDGEVELYKALWPKPAYMMAAGHTMTLRVAGLAQWMGFRRIDIYGADCALGNNDVAHANGESAAAAYNQPLVITGEIDGRIWRTRPDMLMGAVDLVRRVRESRGTIRLIGDTLPVALLGLSDETLDRVCRPLTPEELKKRELNDG